MPSGRFRYLDPHSQERLSDPLIQPLFEKGSGQDWIKPLVRRLVSEGKQVIVFRAEKGETKGCARYLADYLNLPAATPALNELPAGDLSRASRDLRYVLENGVAFHNADLEREERHVVERHFRQANSLIRVIVATTTLAMGINTPAEAVIIEGLEHPGDPSTPYTVAEYKNMLGRAGRLGLATEGTAYLITWQTSKEHYYWTRYVKGVPENLESQFISKQTDPQSLLLRILASSRHLNVAGMTMDDAISFLENSFGAFQQRQLSGIWKWNRQQLISAFQNLELHGLVTLSSDGFYQPTELGRFAGESGVLVESIIRLVAVLRNVPLDDITDPALIVATQVTVELDAILFPFNKKSMQKEPTHWRVELQGQNIPPQIMNALQYNAKNQHSSTLRAKKAVACLSWIAGIPMEEIEANLTQFGGSFGGAAGPIRSAASRTVDLLSASARVAEILNPNLHLGDRVSKLLARLEVGVEGPAAPLASVAGTNLSRSDYQELGHHDLLDIEKIKSASDETILSCIRRDHNKLGLLRAAVVAIEMSFARKATQLTSTLPPYQP